MLDSELLAALGLVTVNFQRLEMRIALLIWTLNSFDSKAGEPDWEVGRMVTSQLSFGKMCELVKALTVHRYPDRTELTDELVALAKRASELEGQRNQLVHSFWHIDYEDGAQKRMKINLKNARIVIHREAIIVDEILGVAHEMEKLTEAFNEFTKNAPSPFEVI